MAGLELGSWEPLALDAAVGAFVGAPFRWWVSGGHTLDLHLGRSWRDHGDSDIGVLRCDVGALWLWLADWELQVAAAGHLTPWDGRALEVARHQNNLWCRRSPDGPWILDVTIGEGSNDHWIYRRDTSVQVPWSDAVLRTTDDVPYLAPELQLLFKSKSPRPKDDVDAAEVIPALDAARRQWLSEHLDATHPWQRLTLLR